MNPSKGANGHLPQAIHIGRGVLERDAEKAIPDLDSEIILYCGGRFRSALAADYLQKMGYNRVHSMAWEVARVVECWISNRPVKLLATLKKWL